MTIATFCRDELLAHGPLTLDELTDRAVRAGVTRSTTPRSSVGSAIRSWDEPCYVEPWDDGLFAPSRPEPGWPPLWAVR
jgi:hypothetical protein